MGEPFWMSGNLSAHDQKLMKWLHKWSTRGILAEVLDICNGNSSYMDIFGSDQEKVNISTKKQTYTHHLSCGFIF